MNPREVLSRANRVQQGTPFKVGATLAVVAAAIAVFAVYFVSVTSAPAPVDLPAPPGQLSEQDRSAFEALSRISADILARRQNPLGFGVGVAAAAGVGVIVVWLGLGLTYLMLAAVAALVVAPMWWLGGTAFAQGVFLDDQRRSTLGSLLRDGARLLGGLVLLGAAFSALMQGLRSALTGSGPVFAIARNVLVEAVRMKVSIVFIVILLLFLAQAPEFVNPENTLRYRVQTFLQWGTGLSYVIIAVLVVFFGIATVAFEQRDRQVWQTMTKPVAAWQYVLGKWVGVAGLAAVLMAVSTGAVFLFTEYLRQQPAHGEDRAVAGAPAGRISQDRFNLETQVLTARADVEPDTPLAKTDEGFLQGVKSYIESRRVADPTFAADDATYRRVVNDLHKQLSLLYRSVGPGATQSFRFSGLAEAKRLHRDLVLRYRIDAGSNLPSTTFKLTFIFGGFDPAVEECGLGTTHNVALSPGVINDDGTVELAVINGNLATGIGNPETILFPPGGLSLSYTVGGFHANFLRAALLLWAKLAVLAMLGIAAGTFLSFPVACLVAFSVFVAAEGAGFLSESLQYYDAIDEKRNILPHRVVIRAISLAVAGAFRAYADVRPTARLVDGRMIAWSSVATGAAALAVGWTALYGGATLIFRRRELATYSGQ